MALGIELCERCKTLTRAAVAVWVIKPRQMNSRRRHIRSVELEIVKIVIDARRPASHVAVPEILRDPRDAQQLHVSGRQGIQIILEPDVIKDSVRRNVLGPPGREDRLPLDVVSRRQIQRNELVLVIDRLIRLRVYYRGKYI